MPPVEIPLAVERDIEIWRQLTSEEQESWEQREVHPTILAAAKLMKCDTCQASASVSLQPVMSGRLTESEAVLQVDNFHWKHPMLEIYTKDSLLVDMASRVTVVRIWKTSPRAESLGSVSHLWKQERC